MKPLRVVRLSAMVCGGVLWAASGASIIAVPVSPSPLPTVQNPIEVTWDKARQSRLTNALIEDARGRLLVATEDKGVSLRGRRGLWTIYTSRGSSLPDDIVTCFALDKQGRVWAGTARSGVAIFDGSRWKKFGAMQGAFGEHIFHIAVNPLDGDVWLATNEGLTRYSPFSDKWRFYTRADGLKTEKIQRLAFLSNGDIVLGTQTHGVWIGRALKDAKGHIEYSNWRGATTWDTPGDTPTGSGLPSNLINDILVAQDGTLFVATTAGLAWSRDNGQNWRYARGRDWADKVRGRVGGAPQGWQPKGEASLSEDYVTALAQDASGRLFIGHRATAYEVWTLNDKTSSPENVLKARIWSGEQDAAPNQPRPDDFVTAILPLRDGQVAIARYGDGLTISEIAPAVAEVATTQSPQKQTAKSAVTKSLVAPTSSNIEYSKGNQTPVDPPFPTPIAAPTLAELNALLARLRAVPRSESASQWPVVALSDDWTTRGDWLGRYGRYWANLCAMAPPEFGGDYIWGAGAEPVDYQSRIGLGQEENDSLRYWVSTLHTDNPNSLEMPPTYLHSRVVKGLTTWNVNRRQSEIDDHGEESPRWRDGFGAYVSLRVPDGDFVLSLYNWNKDGDGGDNRIRDYRISIRRQPIGRSLYDISEFADQPEWARGRLRDFRSGVWKRFFVRGPQQLTVEVGRNFSFNTILAGITLDKFDEKPAPYFRTVEQDRVLDEELAKQKAAILAENEAVYARRFALATSESAAANKLYDALDALRLTNPTWHASESRRYYFALALWCQAQNQTSDNNFQEVQQNKETQTMNARLGTCFYALRMFNEWERMQRKSGLTSARDIEKSLRWDGQTMSNSGRGFEVVINQLNVQKRTSAQIAPHKTTP